MSQSYYPSYNPVNYPYTWRRINGQQHDQRITIKALVLLRTLSVEECCDLAEQYTLTNIPPDLQPWSRKHKNFPIMHRAFFACRNLVQWGMVKCP
jgi:hypothetical protein